MPVLGEGAIEDILHPSLAVVIRHQPEPVAIRVKVCPWSMMLVPDPIIGNGEQDPLIFLQGLGGGEERHLCGIVVLFSPPGLLLTCTKYFYVETYLAK